MNNMFKKVFSLLMVMAFLVGFMEKEAMAMGKWPAKKKSTGTVTTPTQKTKTSGR